MANPGFALRLVCDRKMRSAFDAYSAQEISFISWPNKTLVGCNYQNETILWPEWRKQTLETGSGSWKQERKRKLEAECWKRKRKRNAESESGMLEA